MCCKRINSIKSVLFLPNYHLKVWRKPRNHIGSKYSRTISHWTAQNENSSQQFYDQLKFDYNVVFEEYLNFISSALFSFLFSICILYRYPRGGNSDWISWSPVLLYNLSNDPRVVVIVWMFSSIRKEVHNKFCFIPGTGPTTLYLLGDFLVLGLVCLNPNSRRKIRVLWFLILPVNITLRSFAACDRR